MKNASKLKKICFKIQNNPMISSVMYLLSNSDIAMLNNKFEF